PTPTSTWPRDRIGTLDDVAAAIHIKEMIDLHGVEAGEIEVIAYLDKAFEFATQLAGIPAGIERKAVERQAKGAQFRVRPAMDDDHGHFVMAERVNAGVILHQ